MALAIAHSRGLDGLNAPPVTVEAHLASGLPSFTLVGLPDTEVKEARDRVRAAIVNSGFEFPSKRITVNLAPADLPKESGRFDLPIALGILAASGQIPGKHLADYEFAGNFHYPANFVQSVAPLPWPCRPQATASISSCRKSAPVKQH
jgi:magnesium chelatase family protein